MQKILPYLFLVYGLYNLANFANTFVNIPDGPFRVLFWDTDLNGYRGKLLVYGIVFCYAFWLNYKKNKNN